MRLSLVLTISALVGAYPNSHTRFEAGLPDVGLPCHSRIWCVKISDILKPKNEYESQPLSISP